MMDSTDMSTPVTRGELQDALGLFQRELKHELTLERRQELQAAVAPLATKAELQAAIAPLATKAELQAAIAPLATKTELQAAIAPLATKTELQELRKELHAAVAPLATKVELQELRKELHAAVAPLATKVELEMWGGALVARIQQGEQRLDNLIGLVQQTQQQIQHSERRFSESLQQTEQRLLAELGRHTSAIQEATRTQIKASTEPFDDLPGRVSRLETEVFGPTPRAKRTRRRSH